jgi:hypothetical protein
LPELISELILKERSTFRREHNIGESDLLLFLAPGNRENEIPWAIKRARDGIAKFMAFP